MRRDLALLTGAAVTAVVTVAAAVIITVNNAPTSIKKITGTSDSAPGLAWSVDAAAMVGKQFAEFRDPRFSSQYDSGQVGYVEHDGTIVTMVGITSPDAYTLTDTEMVGIDGEDGTVLWRTPTPAPYGCGSEIVENKLVCYTDYDSQIVTFDLTSGETHTAATGLSIFAISTTPNGVYVAEGSPEDDDIRLHAGTVDDVSASWTQQFDLGASYEDLYGNIIGTDHGVGLLQLGGEVVGFDLGTGDQTWEVRYPECTTSAAASEGEVTVRIANPCDGYTRSGQELRSAAGTVLATSTVAESPSLDLPTDATVPVLLGDGAYDRSTGEQVWSDAALVTTPTPDQTGTPTAPQGTAQAVVGDVALLYDYQGQVLSALDLRTGKHLWSLNGGEYANIPAAWNGSSVVYASGQALTAVDVESGEMNWTIPFLAIDADSETFAQSGRTTALGDRWIHVSQRRMIGLAPLP